MNAVKLTFLGSGDAFARGRYWNSVLISGRLLLDPSPIALPHLRKLNADPGDITHIFISHFHADHYFGLPFLFLELSYGLRRSQPLHLVTPPRGQATVEALMKLAYPELRLTFPVIYHEIGPSPEWVEIEGLPVRVFSMCHGQTPVNGYLFRLPGDFLIGYTGDTSICPEVIALIEASDLVILEASDEEAPEALEGHLPLRELFALVEQYPQKPLFFLTHLNRADFPRIRRGNVWIVEDLKTYEVQRWQGSSPS